MWSKVRGSSAGRMLECAIGVRVPHARSLVWPLDHLERTQGDRATAQRSEPPERGADPCDRRDALGARRDRRRPGYRSHLGARGAWRGRRHRARPRASVPLFRAHDLEIAIGPGPMTRAHGASASCVPAHGAGTRTSAWRPSAARWFERGEALRRGRMHLERPASPEEPLRRSRRQLRKSSARAGWSATALSRGCRERA